MVEAKIKVEIFEHGDVGSPMKRKQKADLKEKENDPNNIIINEKSSSDQISESKKEENEDDPRLFRTCFAKIAEDTWDLQKLGMLKPYELTRFVLKIDIEGQFAGQLLGKLCWHWMEQPVPVGSRFF